MRKIARVFLFAVIPLLGLAAAAAADPGSRPRVALTYIDHSSTKVEQIIGDFDYAAAGSYDHPAVIVPTVSQTATRFHVAGNGLGYSFEHCGRLIFLFGDTISEDPVNLNFHAADPVGWSATTDPDDGLLLNFYTQSNGLPLFVEVNDPSGHKIPLGADAIPNSGVSVNGNIYLNCNSGADVSRPDPHVADFSFLVRFDDVAQTFTYLRQVSAMDPGLDKHSPQQGHFIFNAFHESGPYVLVFGVGLYRHSDIYLARVPKANFETGQGTEYLTGVDHGAPQWSPNESDARPIVFDQPPLAPPQAPWPNDDPTIGNHSVAFSPRLGLWLMTYDGGRQAGPNKDLTTGIYFCSAPAPWGPWSQPQLIFNDTRDNAYGVFVSNYDPSQPSIAGTPAGPVIGDNDLGDPSDPGDTDPVAESPDDNDPTTTRGGTFAPQMIERFTRIKGDTLTITYTLSTWNPYTVVKMRSDFHITSLPPRPDRH